MVNLFFSIPCPGRLEVEWAGAGEKDQKWFGDLVAELPKPEKNEKHRLVVDGHIFYSRKGIFYQRFPVAIKDLGGDEMPGKTYLTTHVCSVLKLEPSLTGR